MAITNNVNDLDLATRQRIADTAKKAGMSAEQVKAQLESK
jgi:cell division protein FtsL